MNLRKKLFSEDSRDKQFIEKFKKATGSQPSKHSHLLRPEGAILFAVFRERYRTATLFCVIRVN
jgi:hypothetical protein